MNFVICFSIINKQEANLFFHGITTTILDDLIV